MKFIFFLWGMFLILSNWDSHASFHPYKSPFKSQKSHSVVNSFAKHVPILKVHGTNPYNLQTTEGVLEAAQEMIPSNKDIISSNSYSGIKHLVAAHKKSTIERNKSTFFLNTESEIVDLLRDQLSIEHVSKFRYTRDPSYPSNRKRGVLYILTKNDKPVGLGIDGRETKRIIFIFEISNIDDRNGRLKTAFPLVKNTDYYRKIFK